MHHNEKKKNIAEVFDRSAATYDTVGPKFFTYFGRRMVELTKINPNAHVLDIACGRGSALFPACERLGPHGHIVGIDLSKAMIDATRQDIAKRMISNAEVRVMDAEHLDFPDASFDCILGGFCLFFFPDLLKALREIRRVLKPQGSVMFSTWGKAESRGWHIRLAKKHLPASVDGKPVVQLFSHNMQFEKPSEIQELFRTAGFSSVHTQTEEKNFFYTSEEEWWLVQYSHGMRKILETVEHINGVQGLERFKTDAFEHIRQFKCPEGFRETMKVLFSTANKSASLFINSKKLI